LTNVGLTAIDLATHSQAWSAEFSGQYGGGAPSVANGVVYIAASDGRLLGFPTVCAAKCAPVWTAHIDASRVVQPVAFDGMVYADTTSGLFAFPAACGGAQTDCAPTWVGAIEADTAAWPPAVADGRVFVPGPQGSVLAFDARCATGGGQCTPVWRGETIGRRGAAASSVIVARGIVYATVYELAAETSLVQRSHLFAFPIDCGGADKECQPIWHATLAEPTVARRPAAADGKVYFVTGPKLYAFDANCETGGPVCGAEWTYTLPTGYESADVSVANRVVYLAERTMGSGGRIVALPAACADPGGCQPLWSYGLGASPAGEAVPLDGVLYAAAGTGFGAFTPGAPPAAGALVDIAGPHGCVASGTLNGCSRGRALPGASEIALDPSGRSLYVTAPRSIAVFRRDPASGAVTQLPRRGGCVSTRSGSCTHVSLPHAPERDHGEPLVHAPRVSPDGRHFYFISADSVRVFKRRDDGSLVPVKGTRGCVGAPAGCGRASALERPNSLAFSPDGKYLYVTASSSRSLLVFRRDARTGQLRQLRRKRGCLSAAEQKTSCSRWPQRFYSEPGDISVSADGRNVYVGSSYEARISVLRRNPRTGLVTPRPGRSGCFAPGRTGLGCTPLHETVTTYDPGSISVSVSPDGRHLYGRMVDQTFVFSRNRADGRLTQTRALSIGVGGDAPVFSPDGNTAYSIDFSVLSRFGTVDVTDADPIDGGLTRRFGEDGCLAPADPPPDLSWPFQDPRLECERAPSIPGGGAVRIAVSPDGRDAYVASPGVRRSAGQGGPAPSVASVTAFRRWGAADSR
jgi:DNA-binding beta-propeller fold protein YncE/outer membrane protein assembly factor BamB